MDVTKLNPLTPMPDLSVMDSHVHFIGETMSEVKTVSTVAAFIEYAQACPISTVAELSKVLKGKPLESLSAAHIRTENTQIGIIASLYTVTKGIIECLAYGQKTKLSGFEVASKRVGGGFHALVALNIVSDAGVIQIGVDATSKGKADYTRMMESIMPFVALVWAERVKHKAAATEAAKVAREAKQADKVTGETVADTAPAAPATGAAPSEVVSQCIALIQSGLVSEADMRALSEAIHSAPITEAAPVLTLGFTPTKKARKARKPKATA